MSAFENPQGLEILCETYEKEADFRKTIATSLAARGCKGAQLLLKLLDKTDAESLEAGWLTNGRGRWAVVGWATWGLRGSLPESGLAQAQAEAMFCTAITCLSFIENRNSSPIP